MRTHSLAVAVGGVAIGIVALAGCAVPRPTTADVHPSPSASASATAKPLSDGEICDDLVKATSRGTGAGVIQDTPSLYDGPIQAPGLTKGSIPLCAIEYNTGGQTVSTAYFTDEKAGFVPMIEGRLKSSGFAKKVERSSHAPYWQKGDRVIVVTDFGPYAPMSLNDVVVINGVFH